MAIYRNKTQQFTVIAQSIMRDDRLSLKDIGLLVRLLSLPDNWEFSENGLMQIFKNDGQASIRTGLKNLEKCGYLERKRTRDAHGRLSNVEWIIYDNPRLENPSLDNPNLENQPQSNTNISTTKEISIKENKVSKGGKNSAESYDSIISEYTEDESLRKTLVEFVKMRQMIKKPPTDYALRLITKKLDKLTAVKVNGKIVREGTPEEKVAVLEQSIANGWQDVYEVKTQGRNGANGKSIGASGSGAPPRRVVGEIIL